MLVLTNCAARHFHALTCVFLFQNKVRKTNPDGLSYSFKLMFTPHLWSLCHPFCTAYLSRINDCNMNLGTAEKSCKIVYMLLDLDTWVCTHIKISNTVFWIVMQVPACTRPDPRFDQSYWVAWNFGRTGSQEDGAKLNPNIKRKVSWTICDARLCHQNVPIPCCRITSDVLCLKKLARLWFVWLIG